MLYILSLSILLLLLAFLYQETTGLVLEKVQIRTPFRLDEAIHIVQLSDLHFRGKGRVEGRVIHILKRLNPHLILLTGDYMALDEKKDTFFVFLKDLAKEAPIYAVRGNHDYRRPYLEELFLRAGITLLSNRGVFLQLKGLPLTLLGVESPDLGYARLEEAASPFLLEESFTIVLAHTYHIIEDGKGKEIDLYLVGDTHGGQINIPFISQLLLKDRYGMDYLGGLYSLGDAFLYVNRGLGRVLFPLRIGSRPEMTLFTLK